MTLSGFKFIPRKMMVPALGLWLMAAAALTSVNLAAGSEPEPGADDPLWPLDLETRYLTSNFMEYRSGRFHAGLDLKTQSKSGFAARAVEDGSIVRVRATPFAYGRAVYLLGDSGRTYVYAHLSRFNDTLRARVREAQAKSGTYRTRLYFEPGKIRVHRGEVLGLTGESGTGGPHLHFEVRDPGNGPVNPLGRGFSVPDRMPPVIHAVRAIPAGNASRIDGELDARVIKGVDGKGLSGTQGPLRISGPVAFAAKIIDASDVAGHKLEPWLIEVKLDGELVYRCRNDRFEFGENSLQRLEWLEVPGIRDRWLHVRPGNSLEGREGGEWFRGLEPGTHDLVIEASDFAGNKVAVDFPLVVTMGTDTLELAQSTWMNEPIVVEQDSLSHNNLHPFIEVNNEKMMEGGKFRFTPAAGDPVLDSTFLVRQEMAMEQDQSDQVRRQGLAGAGFPARYLAADWPIDAALPVPAPRGVGALVDSLPAAKDPGLLVYRWSGREWQPGKRLMERESPGSAFRFALSSPGTYVVFRDVAAPVIFPADTVVTVPAETRDQVHGVTLPRWEIFPLGLVDPGSGIAPESIEAHLDGVPLVVEPDLPRDRVLVELPSDLAAGSHLLRLRVADKAGNTAEKSVALECLN